MSKIRFAVVEDVQLYLDDRCENLDELRNECDIEVVIKAHDAEEFFAEYRKNPDNVDALILDIDLTGSYTGLQIAEKVKKPSLFVSGFNKKYLDNIEDLSDRIDVVMHISKPMSDEKFKNKVRSFCNEIRLHQFHNQMLTFKRNGSPVKISARDIDFLESVSDGSNNKMIYFKKDKPLQLNDFSFSRIAEWSLSSVSIVQASKSCYVNKEHIENKEQNEIKVSCMDDGGKMVAKTLQVSPNYIKNIR